MREIQIKIPKIYRPYYERAKEKRKTYLRRGIDVTLFHLMAEEMIKEEKQQKGFPGFRL